MSALDRTTYRALFGTKTQAMEYEQPCAPGFKAMATRHLFAAKPEPPPKEWSTFDPMVAEMDLRDAIQHEKECVFCEHKIAKGMPVAMALWLCNQRGGTEERTRA